jgi:hypothetical protein
MLFGPVTASSSVCLRAFCWVLSIIKWHKWRLSHTCNSGPRFSKSFKVLFSFKETLKWKQLRYLYVNLNSSVVEEALGNVRSFRTCRAIGESNKICCIWWPVFDNVCFMLFPCIIPLQTKRRPLYLKPQSVPRCKHFPSRL